MWSHRREWWNYTHSFSPLETGFAYGLVAKPVWLFGSPMDCSLPGSSVHGIFQGRILECVAISSSKESCQPRDQTQVSCISCIADRFFTAEPLWYGEHGKIWMGCGFSRADNKDEKRSGTASDIGKSWISCEVFSFFLFCKWSKGMKEFQARVWGD